MHYLKLLPLICILFVSCEKESQGEKAVCSSPPCNSYVDAWQELMQERNNLTNSYFQDHFLTKSSEIIKTDNGEQFVVDYTVTIDWAVIELQDAFMVRISENEEVYPGSNLHRGDYLSKDEIDALISYRDYDSQIHEIAPVEHLGFTSAREALDAIRARMKTKEMYFDYIDYKSSNGGFRANGHPFLFSHGKEDPVTRTRMNGEIDLVSKSILTYPTNVQDKTPLVFTP